MVLEGTLRPLGSSHRFRSWTCLRPSPPQYRLQLACFHVAKMKNDSLCSDRPSHIGYGPVGRHRISDDCLHLWPNLRRLCRSSVAPASRCRSHCGWLGEWPGRNRYRTFSRSIGGPSGERFPPEQTAPPGHRRMVSGYRAASRPQNTPMEPTDIPPPSREPA